MTSYNRRIYRIDWIEYGMSPADGFTNDKGEKIKFIDYYKNQYKCDIKEEGQPLLVHIDQKKDET